MRMEYSTAVELALTKSMALAQAANLSEIRPLDLLHGLLAESEGQAAYLLEAAHVAMDRLWAAVPTAPTGLGSLSKAALARPSADILAQARELARVYGAEGTIASEHVLLAILEGDSGCRFFLEDLGLDLAALKERIAPSAPDLPVEEPIELAPPGETIDVARILDASANRAREALRVLEDYTRFVRNDVFLTAQLKELRHRLAAALAELPAGLLLQARDTLGDVGTTVSTEREQQRASSRDVVLAAAKRLQEALRSLEEYGKVLSPTVGMAIEQLRYQSYSLERAMLQGADARSRLATARIHVLVTDAICRTSLVGTVSEALAGGADVIQLREKTRNDRDLLAAARDLRKMTRSAGALFIVNDRPDIAFLAEADGVHVGQDDLPIHEARRVLGPNALIGVSTHTIEQVRRAVLAGASYLGIGPTFPSKTKEFAALAGLEFVRAASAETSLPAFALGGVTEENLPALLEAGGKRVALSHAVCAAEEPRAVVARMKELLEAVPL